MKICLAQCNSNENSQSNLEFAEKTLITSAKNDCDLVVFPELFLTGYIASEKTKSIAITVNHESIKHLESICKANNIACIFGFPRQEKTKVFNSACFIDKDGTIVGIYDKTHLFGDEKLFFSPGNELKVFNSSFGKVGLLICYDIEIPETARSLALKGAEMIVCISANMKPYDNLHKLNIFARAIENSIPVIYCNCVGNSKKFTFVGQSNIIDQNGRNECKFSKHNKLIYGSLNINEKNVDKNMNYIPNLRCELYDYKQK